METGGKAMLDAANVARSASYGSFREEDMASAKFTNIVLFGPPGVGKGAQASILCHRHALPHLSTGEVIRDEIKKGSELGKRVQEAVGRGEFADDETVLDIIMHSIDLPELQAGFVMDGFPRNLIQARRLDEMMAERGREIDCALFLSADSKVVLERLHGRRICADCSATYHKEYKRPSIHGICDDCGGKVKRRHDDSPEVFQQRLDAYQQKTAPLFEFYQKAGKLSEVDAARTIDEVAAEIYRVITADE